MFINLNPTLDNILLCCEHLKKSNLVCIPTDTVYGLAGNAFDDVSVKKIFQIKQRPSYNPLIAHFYDMNHIAEECFVPDIVKDLAKLFMPGPLSVILKKKDTSHLSSLCSNSLNLQAVRIPNNQVALKLIEIIQMPLVAPSANISNTLTTTEPWHIIESFKNYNLNETIYILDDGKCDLGIESSVIEIIDNKINILRYGSLDINKLLNNGFKIHNNYINNKIISPGMLTKHYSPKATLRLNATFINKNEALLAFGDINFDLPKDVIIMNLSKDKNLLEASKNLFTMLWELDKLNVEKIAIMPIPNIGLGIAINDRLNRACATI